LNPHSTASHLSYTSEILNFLLRISYCTHFNGMRSVVSRLKKKREKEGEN